MEIYSTLTRSKETFETMNDNRINLFVCGPTVYDDAHIISYAQWYANVIARFENENYNGQSSSSVRGSAWTDLLILGIYPMGYRQPDASAHPQHHPHLYIRDSIACPMDTVPAPALLGISIRDIRRLLAMDDPCPCCWITGYNRTASDRSIRHTCYAYRRDFTDPGLVDNEKIPTRGSSVPATRCRVR